MPMTVYYFLIQMEEAAQSIRYIQQVAQHYGLEINKEKSNILIYNKRNNQSA